METNNSSLIATLKLYFTGIIVANSPVWVFNTYRDIIINNFSITHLLLILCLSTLMGGALAGFLIARRTRQGYHIAVGVTTGGFSYLFYTALSVALKIVAVPYEDLVIIIGFVVGGSIGAMFWVMHIARVAKKLK